MTTLRMNIVSILMLLLAFPVALPASAAGQEESSAPATHEEATTWEKTKEATGDAVDWTAEKSRQGWEATKEGTVKAYHWTAEKSRQGWEATKKGTGNAVHWVKEKTGHAEQGNAAAHAASGH